MKNYEAQHGIALDGSFNEHVAQCVACQKFKEDSPASASLLCLEGSILLKRRLAASAPKRESAPHNPNHVGLAEAKRIMRYK